jgi:hypothetical protein
MGLYELSIILAKLFGKKPPQTPPPDGSEKVSAST